MRARDYVAGSLVSNCPVWLLSLMIQYLRAVIGEILTVLLLFFITMVGGILAGYLVAKRTKYEHVKTGLSIGLFSYILYAVFLTITGFRGGLEDIPAITGFVIGGATGTRLSTSLSRNPRM
mgnify:CR=1 FL=1